MLSCEVYIFYKSNNNRFVTYPDDGSRNILIDFGGRAGDKESRICVYRRRDLTNLMYYAFVRKVGNQPVGICVVLNDAYFDDINQLFLAFERCFGELLFEGLTDLSAEGELSISLGSISEKGALLERMKEKVRLELGHVKISNHLPAYNLKLSGNEKNWLKSTGDNRTLVQSTFQFPYTFIEKKVNYESEFINRMNMVTSTWRKWNNALEQQNNNLNQQNSELKKKNDALNRRQKQYGKVFFFFIFAVVLGVILYFVKGSLNDTKALLTDTQVNLEDTQQNLEYSLTVNDLQKDSIRNLKKDYADLVKSYKVKSKILDNLTLAFEDREQPFFVTKTYFNFETGIFTFNYYGIYEDTVTVTIRAVNGSEIYANSQEIVVNLLENESSIYLSDELNPDQYYSFEVQVGDHIVGGVRF